MRARDSIGAGVRPGLLALLLLAGFTAAAGPGAHAAQPIEGLWLTQDRDGVIRIAPCADQLCGWIVGLDLKPGEPMPKDYQGRPQCGLQLIRDAQPSAPQQWRGTITNPRDGKNYDARLTIGPHGELQLRGYVLVPLFGATQTWTRYPGSVTPSCQMQEASQ